MKKRVFLVFSALAVSFILSSCSALKKQMLASYLKKGEDLKAAQLKFKEPPSPYIKEKHEALDGFWLHKKKASSISYFSSCSSIPRSLETFQTSSYPSHLNYKVLERVKTPNSFYSVLEIQKKELKDGKAQSIETVKNSSAEPQGYIAIYSLRKKNCFFNLNLTAPSEKTFQEESALFQNFIQNFKPL